MKINTYPDGTSYVEVPDSDPEFTYLQDSVFRINSYEDLWHLVQFVDVMNNMGFVPNITIPNLLDGQADKRFKHNQSSGLKLVCNLLNSLDANFKIFHPHNAEVVEALMNNIEIVDNYEFISKVLSRLYSVEHVLETELVILLPDGGAYKWGAKLADKVSFEGDVLAAAKNRKFVDGKSILTQQLPNYDFTGKSVLIIDDICVYGGTFIGLSKLLKERNIGKLYLAVSHMTIQNFKSSELFDCFDSVFTTNSKYDSYFVPNKKGDLYQPDNLKVINLFQ